MLDKEKSLNELLREGYAIAVFAPVVIQTSTPAKYIAALDVKLFHSAVTQSIHDVKPWLTAVGNDNGALALTQSRQFLIDRINDQTCTLKAIMDANTVA